MKNTDCTTRLLLAALATALLAAAAGAAETTVWQIGTFDNSSHEFTGRFDFSRLTATPVFTIGTSDAATDWPASQPGSKNSSAGARPHPISIVFNLPGKPRGGYTLVVAAVLTHSRVPFMKVELNGKTGYAYFERKVSYDAGNPGYDSPIYGTGRIELPIAAEAFRPGENHLTLTAMDNAEYGSGDSWLAYDALQLENDIAAKPTRPPVVSAAPSVFFVSHEGHTSELTRFTVTSAGRLGNGKLAVLAGGQQLQQPLDSSVDFGEQRFMLPLPQYTAGAEARVTLSANGRVYRIQLTMQPMRQWTIDVVPHAHLDVGFTDYQAKVAEIHDRNIDQLIKEIGEHPEMRFSLDGSWIVQHYLATRNAAARERFIADVRQGKIGVPVQFANLMTGYPTLEELIRSTSYSQQLHHTLGFPFEYANITDVPSYTGSYPSVLRALGVKYLAAASNNDRAPILLYGRWNERSPFWWQGPDGSKILMSYSRQYFQLSFVCGVPATEAACRQSLPTFLQQYESPSYKPDTVLMYGSQIENTDLIPGEPQFIAAWNKKYIYPHLVLATFPDYFHSIEKRFGSQLETVAGDGGPYWEDGFGTDAWYGAMNRANQQRALSAEKLATLAVSLNPTLAGPRALLTSLWQDIVLYSEHTFTSWGGYSRPRSDETVRQFQVKDARVNDGRNALHGVLDQAFSQLADQIHVPAQALVVFNSLNWTRSGLVDVDLDAGAVLREYPAMQVVPYEVLRRGSGYNHIRFMASNVPSLGYKCYQVIGAAAAKPEQQNGSGSAPEAPPPNLVENQFYRVVFDPEAGAIRSVFDKQLGRELATQAGLYRLNQYVYVAGGEDRTQLVHYGERLPFATLHPMASSGGRALSLRRTPYGQVFTYQTSGPHAPIITSEVMLYDGEKRIDFINHFHKQPVSSKEAVDFAFPFAIDQPRFSYEIQNGWVDPGRDILQGGSLEWFTVQHWVRVANGQVAVGLVPLDAPLVSLGDINRGVWPRKFDPPSATVFSYVLNNYWHTNFRRVQSGDFTFRYSLTSGAQLSAEQLTRLGNEAMTPLEHAFLSGNDKFGNPPRPLSAAPASFLQVRERGAASEAESGNVLVVDWKLAEDGNGTVLRLLETAGHSANVRLVFPLFSVQRAFVDTAAEDQISELAVNSNAVDVNLAPHQILTLRILIKR